MEVLVAECAGPTLNDVVGMHALVADVHISFMPCAEIVIDLHIDLIPNTRAFADAPQIVEASRAPEPPEAGRVQAVTNLVGAYFVGGGPIQFEGTSLSSDPVLTATGLFVGNSIVLGRGNLNLTYDSAAIGQRTPPGFGVVSFPGIRETAP